MLQKLCVKILVDSCGSGKERGESCSKSSRISFRTQCMYAFYFVTLYYAEEIFVVDIFQLKES
jgi:hypothetical protein